MSTNVAEVHAAYRSASYHSVTPTPRCIRLYADLWLAWGESRGERSRKIGSLLQKLAMRQGEITPEEDAAMRQEVGL